MVRIRWSLIAMILQWSVAIAQYPSDDLSQADTNELVSNYPWIGLHTNGHDWPSIKAGIFQMRKEAYYRNAERSFHSYVKCFMTNAKRALEFYGNFTILISSKILQKQIKEQAIKVPLRIRKINETYDSWIHTPKPRNRRPANGNKNNKSKKGDDSVDKLTKYFRNYYHLLSSNLPYQPVFFKTLSSDLDSYYNLHSQRYKNKKNLYKIFSAVLSRWFLLLCALNHDVMETVRQYSASHLDLEYHDAFFRIIPNWYLDDEQLDFLDIFQKRVNEGNPFQIDRLYVKNMHGPIGEVTVVLPYTYSNDCGKESFFHTKTYSEVTPVIDNYDYEEEISNCTTESNSTTYPT